MAKRKKKAKYEHKLGDVWSIDGDAYVVKFINQGAAYLTPVNPKPGTWQFTNLVERRIDADGYVNVGVSCVRAEGGKL